MYARVTTFEVGAQANAMVERVRADVEADALPAGLDGTKGITMLVDHERGAVMTIMLFESEEALRRGDEALNAMSPGGDVRRTSVEFYELALERRR